MNNSAFSNISFKVKVTLALLILLIPLYAAGYTLSGRITDENDTPLPGALFKITLSNSNPEVSMQTAAGEDGAFRLDSVPKGDYNLRVSCEGFHNATGQLYVDHDYHGIVVPLNADPEAQAAIRAKELEEVEVIANALQTYADRDEMYLTSFNRKYGVNALDAISSLPKFKPTINGQSLQNNLGKDVSILIDGRKADIAQLRNLKGSDIAKVIYYDDAPAKYRGLYGGSVANIILRRPKELRVDGKIDAQTGLSAPHVYSALGLTMFSPAGLLNAGYQFSYRNMTGIRSREVYDYGDLVNSLDMTSARSERKRNKASVSYQYNLGKNLFYADFKFDSSDAHNREQFDLSERTADSSVEGERKKSRHPYSDSFSLDLYYSHDFGSDRELMVDVVGTIAKNHDGRMRVQSTGEGSANDDYLENSMTDALLRSIIANVSYTSPLWGGSASVSLMNHYRHVHQNYRNSLFPDLPSLNVSATNYSIADFGYSRQFGKFGMYLELSFIDYLTQGSDGKDHNEFYLSPLISLNYRISRDINLKLRGWLESTLRGSGTQNLNRYLIDTRFFRENIPYMKPEYRYRVMLNPDINIPSARLMILPVICYTWKHNKYIQYIYKEGSDFIQRPTLLNHADELEYYLSLIWTPVGSLRITPGMWGDYQSFRTPGGFERFSNVSFSLGIYYSVGQFQFQTALNTPDRSLEGITHSRKGWEFNIAAYWQTPSFYAGVAFGYYGDKSWTRMAVPGFLSLTETTNIEMRNFVTLSLGYNFSIGKYKGSAGRQKKLSNAETDKGM